MQVLTLVALCAIPATAVVANINAVVRRDGDFGSNVPGTQDKSVWGPNDYPMSYPDPSKLFKWDKKESPCKITIMTDVSRCTAGRFRYKNQYIPYDVASTKQLAGHVIQSSKIDNTDFYTHTAFNATDVFRGRLMLTDAPEKNKYIGLMSVRVDISASESRFWIDAEVDEETKQNRQKIAPISYVYWKSQAERGEKSNYMGDKRGFANSLGTTYLKEDTLYVQWC